MAVVRLLTHPPIREAIIEIRSARCPLSRIDEWRESIATLFPRSRPFRLASEALGLPDERRTRLDFDAAAAQVGWRCESEDGRDVVLVWTDGLSMARVGDYPGWDTFAARYLALFDTYRRAVAPAEIERIGLRYVNDIRLPITPWFAFDDYLTSAPRAPKGFAQAYFDFLMHLRLPTGSEDTTLDVMQAADTRGLSTSEIPLIIDVDVGNNRRHTADETIVGHLRDALQQLHEIKNRAFFGLITERLAETYQ
ncbi:MAG: hypothetical protein AMXMBFR52_32000 [Burkholderiales bacterium]|jgi:uncharacterized protein (TIGR04255 family)